MGGGRNCIDIPESSGGMQSYFFFLLLKLEGSDACCLRSPVDLCSRPLCQNTQFSFPDPLGV